MKKSEKNFHFLAVFPVILVGGKNMNTSVNLHYSINKEISELAKNVSMSKSEIVCLLIEKIQNFNFSQEINGALVEYQDRILLYNEKGEKVSAYKKVHFCPDRSLVDFTSSVRFKYRISLSKLVAASFFFFWEQIVKEILGIDKKIVSAINNYKKIYHFFRLLIEYLFERVEPKDVEFLNIE